MDRTERTALGDVFDRTIRSMNGLPDVITTKATTVRSLSSVLELSQTFIVQTYRQKDEGDTIFIEYIGAEGSFTLFINAYRDALMFILCTRSAANPVARPRRRTRWTARRGESSRGSKRAS